MSDEATTEMFDASALGFTNAQPALPYRVLARKYRPSSFEDLIGQEPMVRTLSNAFESNRIHQAYILTGVRGVGKTTTARILARAFNYEVPGKVNAPTIHMPELGIHCQAIIESRHVDVIEMDAASHTGIDDVREIIESARYRPVSARTKVYIIDEVHMLSKQAFNGLLKTLEEPPEHVKFLFATTEIDKVPITVRSRCQRFDLRRVEADVLVKHLAGICTKEHIEADTQALAMVARASEGSVRDSLSLLDQAIAHTIGGRIESASIRTMLGLADRAEIIDLFHNVMSGQCAAALILIKTHYDLGADPAQILTELAEFVHFVTRMQILPETAQDPDLTEDERVRGTEFAKSLSLMVLTRAWQMLLKGLSEVKESNRPLAAAEMVLIRLCYAADLPSPDKALKRLGELDKLITSGGLMPTSSIGSSPQAMQSLRTTASASPQLAASPAAQGQAVMRLNNLQDVIALAQSNRDILLKNALERDVRMVRFEQGQIEFELGPMGSPQLAANLTRRLQEWTGARWMVAVTSTKGTPSLKEQADAKTEGTLADIHTNPLVKSALEHFPGAKIIDVRLAQDAAPAAPPQPEAIIGDEDIGFLDQSDFDEDL
jgi:DNA polymerase III subunit gamma/tau